MSRVNSQFCEPKKMINVFIKLPVLIVFFLSLVACDRDEAVAPVAPTEPSVADSSSGEERLAEGDASPDLEEAPHGNFRVRLYPHKPTADQVLSLDVSGARNIRDYRWEHNGEVVPGAGEGTLGPGLFAKGDEVAVTVIADNGQVRIATLIHNSVPRVTGVEVNTRQVSDGEEIELIPTAFDVDNDPIEYRYTWLVDGVEDPNSKDSTYVASGLQRGDEIGFIVTPFDGEEEGFVYQGRYQVENAAPRFSSRPPERITGGSYRYLAQADDPDGDSLTYALVEGPPGMTIDGSSGKITWDIGEDQAGVYPVKIQAEDAEGKKAVQAFNVDVARP
ncbi:MAG: putative Ig domain-containing protein [Desulfuromonadales bacterium]|nr:putative Ig domain-containing protein [Desulfuromonadales bacterium]